MPRIRKSDYPNSFRCTEGVCQITDDALVIHTGSGSDNSNPGWMRKFENRKSWLYGISLVGILLSVFISSTGFSPANIILIVAIMGVVVLPAMRRVFFTQKNHIDLKSIDHIKFLPARRLGRNRSRALLIIRHWDNGKLHLRMITLPGLIGQGAEEERIAKLIIKDAGIKVIDEG